MEAQQLFPVELIIQDPTDEKPLINHGEHGEARGRAIPEIGSLLSILSLRLCGEKKTVLDKLTQRRAGVPEETLAFTK